MEINIAKNKLRFALLVFILGVLVANSSIQLAFAGCKNNIQLPSDDEANEFTEKAALFPRPMLDGAGRLRRRRFRGPRPMPSRRSP